MKQINSITFVFACLVALGLGGCATVEDVDDLALQRAAFNRCFDAAEAKSDKAVTGKSPALYHIAAKSMQDCLTDVRATPEIAHSKKAIRASALVIVNYIKAGDLDQYKYES